MPRYLITSALPYINGVKHLGNLVGSMLPADVYARFQRAQGHEVLYICATDEHGTPAELAALDADLSVDEFCRQQHETQKDLGERFHLSFDYFGRSSSPENRELTQHFAQQLEENGFIEERQMQQMYSLDDERFLPDRYIVGTCPHCDYEMARGDQCESCTRVLDPTELIEPRSAVSGSTRLEVRESKHLFLLQSRLADEVEKWLDTHDNWPLLVTSIAKKWLTEGIRDRCITRDLQWGVPVDRPGFENKVFYVWFDAPIEYIGATAECAKHQREELDWKSWWYNAEDVYYVQFMAKDNVPFHTIGFPSTVIGSREPWKLVNYIKGFSWMNYYGGKFSTSQGRGVFMNHALELLPADYWRYYLIAQAPESNDSDFTWESFASTVNKDLADTLGNFVNRTLAFASRRFGPEVPAGGEPGEEERRMTAELQRRCDAYADNLRDMEYRKAASELRAIWSLGNAYIDKTAPWTQIKEDKDAAACTLRTAINLVRVLGVLSWPIIPATSERLLEHVRPSHPHGGWVGSDMAAELSTLARGDSFTTPEILFQKIDDDQVAQWSERFGT